MKVDAGDAKVGVLSDLDFRALVLDGAVRVPLPIVRGIVRTSS